MRSDLCSWLRNELADRQANLPGDIIVWALMAALGLAGAGCTYFNTFFDPIALAAKAVSISVDVRSKEEVANDVAIETSCQTRLLQDDKAEWAGVTPLVFAQHLVLVGAVKNELARRRAERLMREDPNVRSLANELVVIRKPGDEGSFMEDRTMDIKINAVLTATPGVGSINMRWRTVNGRVVLMGVAQSRPEAKVAVAKIRSLDGVKYVKSYLRIMPPKK